jgi:hypothetical protein
MSSEHTITVRPNGEIEFIYSDELVDLNNLGVPSLRRMSNVEPDRNGDWVAEMFDGTRLPPRRLRADALASEVQWLEENYL